MKSIRDTSVQYLKGVGPAKKNLFGKLGVFTTEDLLYLFPRRYEDRTRITDLSQLKAGECYSVCGKIVKQEGRQAWFTKKHVCQILVNDGKGQISAVWFNQPFMQQYFRDDDSIILHGKVDLYKDRLQMVSPEYEIIGKEEEGEENLSIGRIVPVYPLTRGVTQRYLRKTIKFCLDHHAPSVVDVLPYSLRNKHNLENIVKSLVNIHFPESFEGQKNAYRRISFEEFFLFQLSVLLRKSDVVLRDGIAHQAGEPLCGNFMNSFPFVLTEAQKKAIKEVAADMKKTSPMHRLLQGDLGSGKTVVAFFGCFVAVQNGFQAAIMAPTEILAKQHFDTLKEFMAREPFKNIRLALLTGSLSKKEKETVYQKLKNGSINLLVGTHSLIQEGLDFKNLSFAVIDEQHKFGVRQRALLPAKGSNPDCLIMTATPIPRTLSLTLYGDLDISTINELPKGRLPVKTMSFSEDRIQKVYDFVKEQLKSGRQAYIIYPLIWDHDFDENGTFGLNLKSAQGM